MSNSLQYGNACEAWLTVAQNGLGIRCMVVRDDETTDTYDVDSLSLRGAEREVTGNLKRLGYEPAGRWQDARDLDHGKSEAWLDAETEVMRQFKRAA